MVRNATTQRVFGHWFEQGWQDGNGTYRSVSNAYFIKLAAYLMIALIQGFSTFCNLRPIAGEQENQKPHTPVDRAETEQKPSGGWPWGQGRKEELLRRPMMKTGPFGD